mgnify:CR=1 FL=1
MHQCLDGRHAPGAGSHATALQPLCAVWRREALLSALGSLERTRDIAARKLLAAAVSVEVPGAGLDTDYDTLDQLATRGDVT